jgi:TatD DNase family protein
MEMYGDYLDDALGNLEKNRIIALSMSNGIPSYERTLAVAEKSELVIPAFGLNPHNAPDVIDRLDIIRDYANKSTVLGEVGLDHFFAKDPATYPLQDQLFEVFLESSKENDCILSIHSRGADRKVAEMLDSYSISRAVIHGYDQGTQLAKMLTDRGIYLSFGGLITKKYEEMVPQWKAIRAAAREVPEDLFLIETDAPGAWPEEMPSERLFTVVDTLSELRGEHPRDLQSQINHNFLKLTDGINELEKQRKLVEQDLHDA